MNRILLLLFVFASSLTATASSDSGGTTVGNGGDFVAQDFVTSAQEGLSFLREHSTMFAFIDVTIIQDAIDHASVSVLPDGISFTDAVRTAENFPQSNEIKVDGIRWGRLSDGIQKMALALHEYLGLTGYEVNNYIITSQLFGIANDQMEMPPTLDELEQSFNSMYMQFEQLVDSAKAIELPAVLGTPSSLSLEQCDLFVNSHFAHAEQYRNLCVNWGASLFSQPGVNPFGVPFQWILKVGGVTQSDAGHWLFLSSDGTVVEQVRVTVFNQKEIPGAVRTEDIAALGPHGDAFEHLMTRNTALLEEQMNVVLADGSLGGMLSKDLKFGSRSPGYITDSTEILAISDFQNWRGFSVQLLERSMDDSNCGLGRSDVSANPNMGIPERDEAQNSSCRAGTTDSGMISFSYSYLSGTFARPDNYRVVEYQSHFPGSSNGLDRNVGKYVANRRGYLIQ